MERGEYVVRVFRSMLPAEAAIHELREAGFRAEDVSVVVPDVHDKRVTSGRVAAGADAPTVVAAATGGVLGGLAGWLLGLAVYAVPGVGPVIATAMIGTAVTGAFLGAGAGVFALALVEMGLSAGEADWYQEQLRAGCTLVTVRADGRADEALRILRYHGGFSPPDEAEVVPEVLPTDHRAH
jgi:hypothetical protein